MDQNQFLDKLIAQFPEWDAVKDDLFTTAKFTKKDDPNYQFIVNVRFHGQEFKESEYYVRWPAPCGEFVPSIRPETFRSKISNPVQLAKSIRKRLFPFIEEFLPKFLNDLELRRAKKQSRIAAAQELCKILDRKPSEVYPWDVSGRWNISNIRVGEDGTGAIVEFDDELPIELVKKLIQFMKENQ